MQYRFDRCVLDTAQFALFRDGVKVDVDPQVLRLIEYLVDHRDRVVPRDEILDKVFSGRIVTDNALSVRVRAARVALGDSAQEQCVIATVNRVGYRFVAAVAVVSHVEAHAAQQISGAPPREHPSNRSSAPEPTVAVLPFDAIGGRADDAVIARGLVHDVTTRIARSRTMYVIARGTAFQFVSGAQDVREVGARLGVRYVAQGAVQVAGRKIRISIALATTDNAREIGSWQYDRALGDVLHIQDEIATLIVSEIEVGVQREEMQRSTLMPSTNLDAWSAYHRGLGHMYRFRSRECDKAEVFFRRAIDLEPGLPRPYAGLSFVNYERAYLNLDGERHRSLRKALDYAAEAIAIDRTDPMGHWAMSRAQFLKGDLDEAHGEIRSATELNPSYATAQYFSGWVAMQRGDHEDGLESIDLARRLSPCDPLIYGMDGVSALILALLGRKQEALERALRASKHPDLHYQAHAMGVVVYALVDEVELARDSLQRVQAVKPDYDVDEFFSVYAFQQDDDIRRLTRAFKDIEGRMGRH